MNVKLLLEVAYVTKMPAQLKAAAIFPKVSDKSPYSHHVYKTVDCKHAITENTSFS